MLISIKRVYVESGIVPDMLMNTNYIIKIETCQDDTKPATRIVHSGFDEPSFIYTNESLATIKCKLTRAQNKQQETE